MSILSLGHVFVPFLQFIGTEQLILIQFHLWSMFAVGRSRLSTLACSGIIIIKRYRRKKILSSRSGPNYHGARLQSIPGRDRSGFASTLLEMAASYLREDHDIVMTHADLHPCNIMVVDGPADSADSTESARNDIKITGIIDWEVLAGILHIGSTSRR